MHFDARLLSKSYKVLVEKVQKSYFPLHWRVMESLRKNWLMVSNMIWGIWWIFTEPLKAWKSHFDELFLSKVYKVWAKKIQRSIFHETEQWCKIWINHDPVVSKMAWRTGSTFIKALKGLKNCIFIGSFYPKHIYGKIHRNYVS